MEKVALVTGGARRVGAGTVRALHQAGWKILLHYRHSATDAQMLADELNARRPDSVVLHGLDLLQTARLPELVEAAVAHFGRLDALINNASSFYPTPMGQITEAAWDDLIGSNLKAPLFLAQAAAPELARNQGAIVNIADIHVERPLAGFPMYTIAKAGVAAMTRVLARELAPAVRVNAIAPGVNLWPENETDFDIAERERILATIPLKRTGQPQDIAQAILYLLEASYITGVILPVDGGRNVFL